MNAVIERWRTTETVHATCQEHGAYEKVRNAAGEVRGRCPTCRSVEHARQEAEAQARLHAQLVDQLWRTSALPGRYAGKSFADYEPKTPMQRKALGACRQYVKDLETRVANGSCLVLIGPPGVGKTHLLAALLRAVIAEECSARYTTMAGFLSELEDNWTWRGRERGAAFTRPTVLAIDEIWDPESSRARATLLALLDERYRAGLTTFVASNLTWPKMQQGLGERFCDRLLEGGGEVLTLDGKSMRR